MIIEAQLRELAGILHIPVELQLTIMHEATQRVRFVWKINRPTGCLPVVIRAWEFLPKKDYLTDFRKILILRSTVI